MRFTRRTRAGVLFMIIALAAAACGDDGGSGDANTGGGSTTDNGGETTTTQTPQDGGIATMGVYIETSGLDPAVVQGGGTGGNHELGTIYGTLLEFDEETSSWVGSMAESLEGNADSTEFTLKLRPDVKFTDGSAYDAEAVVFGLKRHTELGSPTAGQLAIISDYTVVDPLTVKFTLKSPWPDFGYVLANTAGMIPSKTAIEAACQPGKPARECSFNTNPVGAGPFMLERYVPKDSISVTRNPDYWAGPVHLDGVKFVVLQGAALTYQSVKSGQLQVGFLREPETNVTAEEDDSINTITRINGMGGVILLNNGQVTCRNGRGASVCEGKPDGVVDLDKPTGDIRVRKAIAAAINMDTMNERRNNGFGLAGSALFTAGEFEGEPTSEYDPDEAKRLLDEYKGETGWDGSISVTCLDTGAGTSFNQALEALLNAVGFKVNSDIRPATEYVQRVQLTRDYDVACWGMTLPPEAPEAGLARHVLSIAGGNSGGNAMNLNNPDIDAAIVGVREATSVDDKKAALGDLADKWTEVMPSVIYESTRETIASAKDVHGLKVNVATTVMFDEAWIG